VGIKEVNYLFAILTRLFIWSDVNFKSGCRLSGITLCGFFAISLSEDITVGDRADLTDSGTNIV